MKEHEDQDLPSSVLAARDKLLDKLLDKVTAGELQPGCKAKPEAINQTLFGPPTRATPPSSSDSEPTKTCSTTQRPQPHAPGPSSNIATTASAEPESSPRLFDNRYPLARANR